MKVIKRQGSRNREDDPLIEAKIVPVTTTQRIPPSLKVMAGKKHPSIKSIQRDKILDLEMIELLAK